MSQSLRRRQLRAGLRIGSGIGLIPDGFHHHHHHHHHYQRPRYRRALRLRLRSEAYFGDLWGA
ncbi:hypothetical protein ELI55_10845 [Rhizobium ruizarguesonis]|nr:hypothetical protein ELI55_10845 [Rhizobium ruizarguesonis]